MRLTGPTDALISETAAIEFFDARARCASDPTQPGVTMLQDNQRALAEARDKVERQALLDAIAARPHAVRATLDVGCGSGRLFFALRDRLGSRYVGVDGASSLVAAANARLAADDQDTAVRARFAIQDLGRAGLMAKAAGERPFDLIIASGILIYLNDSSVERLLGEIVALAGAGATLVLREPVGIEQRLTLVEHWSDELGAAYNAAYRTRDELQAMVSRAAGGRLANWSQRWLYDEPALNNRSETRQAWMVATLA